VLDGEPITIRNNGEGVKSCNKDTLIHNLTPSRLVLDRLAEQTVSSLRATFDTHGIVHEKQVWTSLKGVACVLASMAEGTCDPDVYVSPLDPGIGKTQTLIHFIQAMIASEHHSDVSALVCIQRKEQIRDIVRDAGLSQEDFAVLTADSDLNALGSSDANFARVLFTTHAQVGLRSRWKGFTGVEAFYYQDRPRQVRVWDETILPGETLVVQRDAFASLLEHVRRPEPMFAQGIEEVFSALGTMKDRATFNVPDLAREHGLRPSDVIKLLNYPSQAQRVVITDIFDLFGRVATVRFDGINGRSLVTYRDTLPKDLLPILVLDASGRVRTTYKFWEEQRGGLKMLPAAPKSYDDLTISVWDRAGGKSAFERDGDVLLKGIAQTMNERPDEEWLVIHHKTIQGMDFEADLRSLLAHASSRVHFLNWGSHDATNCFSHVSNVIIAGCWFLPKSVYEGLGQLAAARSPSSGALSDLEFDEIRLGEHRHFLLQALCRCGIRRSTGKHQEVRAYLIARKETGVPDTLAEVFPGAEIQPWEPIRKMLKGRVRQAAEFIIAHFDRSPSTDVLSFRSVMEGVGMPVDPRNFRRNVRKHPDFQAALADHRLGEVWADDPVGFGRVGFEPIIVDEEGEGADLSR
jgi:hypothetical protein